MHHLYPLAKGDPLCPLGFHPQVRWPTRCKRCFRDYKEHGGKKREDTLRRDDTTASTPSLSWINRDNDSEKRRNWVSSTNLSSNERDNKAATSDQNPSSWTSTPDLASLEDDTQAVTVSLKLPKKKKKPLDTGQKADSFSMTKNDKPVFNREDSLAARVKKLQAIKESSEERVKRIQIKEVKTISDEPTNHDVQFLIQVKTKPKVEETRQESVDNDEDNVSIADTETTDTTLVDTQDNEMRDQIESLRQELETTKNKCERLEREKSDILLRRLAAMETTKSKTTASEVLKLQQKCNELQQQLEDYRDEKKSLSFKVRELEEDLEQRPTQQAAQKIADELRSKLLAAETLCEELMDENEDIKKELRDMEEQMDEMQDNFREDQVVEYTSIKKELDQTTKNCRILSFKLRKAERKAEQVEQEKLNTEKKLKEISGGTALANLDKMKQLEQELKMSNEVSLRLQKELEEANRKLAENNKIPGKKRGPMLGTIGKIPSTDGKVSRDSLTRGGSQDDPAQLLRDLQDSLEREADLREQLKFAEEEAQNLRKKVSRIEDDNESLVLQLKKMASKARGRKLSPTNTRLTPEPSMEKSDIPDEDDPADIKLQLELSEQEASVLRRKVEDLEAENHRVKSKNKDLQEKVNTKTILKRTPIGADKNNSIETQKIKVLEDETNDLRKKLIEKERDCERLHAELSLNQKRSKNVQKSKSLDLDQQTLDLKRQLQIIEQEASVLRTKVQSLESDNEKLIADNKRLQIFKGTKGYKSEKNIDKYIDQIASLEIDLAEATNKIKSLEQNGISNDIKVTTQYKQYFNRTPKKISNLTSKDQLKNMVTDLENEIAEMIVAIKTTENVRIKLEEEIKNLKYTDNSKLSGNELTEEKDKYNKEKSKNEELRKKLNELEEKSKNEIDKINDELRTAHKEKEALQERLTKLTTELKGNKDKELKLLKKELEEKTKTVNELTHKVNDFDNKFTEMEHKLKSSEKQKKDKIREYENKLDDEINKNKLKESENDKLTRKLEVNTVKIEELNGKINVMETKIEHKNKVIEQMENNLMKEREKLQTTEQQLGKMIDELTKRNQALTESENRLKTSENDNIALEDKLKASEFNLKKSKLSFDKRIDDLDSELQSEKKKMETLKLNYDKETKNKEIQLTSLKNKIKTLENTGTDKKTPEITKLKEEINKIQDGLVKKTQKYTDLTAKYELLEEEHVVTKAKLVMEKETLENQYTTTKQELTESEAALKALRETYNTKENAWTKEKLELQEKLKNRDKKTTSNGNDYEKARLQALLEEKQSELENVKKENEMINDQMEYMRKECDELKKKLDDYQKVNKIQRNISADSSAMEKEIRQLKSKLVAADKSRKTDLAECKMRYDNQFSIVDRELQSLQSQVMRFKREKDSYKHMLETAQKTIEELKTNPKSNETNNVLNYDELEECNSRILTLEQQISCMEDELSESRLESSRLKTALVSERSSWEVKVSELHSKINELEEEKILSSGRTKIVGLRTKMELAWQKEREEQQRLLQETATLARDLRQTLFEVERERDKERLESKRKQDQFKKNTEEDQDENKKKINELQCDLLELRDAHAKLRTTNEKLRREKERYEKEREELRMALNGRRRYDREDDRKIAVLLEQVHFLKQLAPELFIMKNKDGNYTPTPPQRVRSKSRESSPLSDRRESSTTPEDKHYQIQSVMQKLKSTAEELRTTMQTDEYDTERTKRLAARRATSTENDSITTRNRKLYSMHNHTTSNLHRKSLSLEHNIQNEQKIWKNESDSLTSLQSFDGDRWMKRDTSLDSRLSEGSTQSDYAGGETKKKKSLIGKLKKLTKSRSIDDKDPGNFPPTKALSSRNNSKESDVSDEKGSKKDLKERITGIFKRAGSSSRSNSLERQRQEFRHDTSSTHRPLVRND